MTAPCTAAGAGWKIAARMVKSARYKYFKLCSSCPYKDGFYETLENIRNLRRQLE